VDKNSKKKELNMIKVTKSLKEWAVKNCAAASDASDAEIRKLVAKAYAEGKISDEDLENLSKDTGASQNEALTLLKELVTHVKGGGTQTTTQQKSTEEAEAPKGNKSSTDNGVSNIADLVKSTTENTIKALADAGAFGSGTRTKAPAISQEGPEPVKLFTMTSEEMLPANNTRVRVVGALESYDHSKSYAVYPENCKHAHLRGQQVTSGENGRSLSHSSQADKAVIGSYFKFMVNAACKKSGDAVPHCYRMTEKDHSIVQYAIHEMPFTGVIGYNENNGLAKHSIFNDKLTDVQIKALIDDSVSGGLEAAPIVFDDAFILTPLLNGEIFPLVRVINLPRGRRVEGFSMSNPTLGSGREGTDIPLFFIPRLEFLSYQSCLRRPGTCRWPRQSYRRSPGLDSFSANQSAALRRSDYRDECNF
jgi:hypothetical protein